MAFERLHFADCDMKNARRNITLRDADRIRTAKECLDRGEPMRAVKELQKLTQRGWRQVRLDHLIWEAAQALE
jgi:hypothetical protein